MTENSSETNTSTKSVTVYGGSGNNIAEIYREHAFELGKLIANEGWVQVNGGGKTGMMGAATLGGRSVGGIVDSVMLTRFLGENDHNLFREQFVFDTLQERKKGLFDRCDAIVALPGGLGTLDELIEVACSRQLGMHEKPIVIVNTDGFFDELKSFIDNAISLRFVTEEMGKGGLYFANDPKHAIEYIKNYHPVVIDKTLVNSGEFNANANAK